VEALRKETAAEPPETETELEEVNRGEPMVIIGIAFCSTLTLLVGICIGWWLRGK
jgi:hypothetical protein